MLSFRGLETKYGEPAAYDLLMQMEKVARIQSWAMTSIDPETRFANALRAQDDMCADPAIKLAA